MMTVALYTPALFRSIVLIIGSGTKPEMRRITAGRMITRM